MQTSDNKRRMPPSDETSREETIRGLYTELALHPASDFAWGKGIENARALRVPGWKRRLPNCQKIIQHGVSARDRRVRFVR